MARRDDDKLRRPINAPDGQPLGYGLQAGNTPAAPFSTRRIIVGGGGDFVYDPKPGAGNLIASLTDALHDPFGDPTVKGVAAYTEFAFETYAVTLNGIARLGFPGISIIDLNTPSDTPCGFYGTASSAGAAESFITSGKSTSGDAEAIVSVQSASDSGRSGGAINLLAGDIFIGNTDSLQVKDSAGQIVGTNGTISSPSLITTDTWHSVTPPANMSGTLRYRMEIDATVMVHCQLAVAAGAGAAAPLTLITFSNATYNPVVQARGPVGFVPNGAPTLAQLTATAGMRWSANTGGTVTVENFTGGGAGSGVTELDFTIRFPVD